MTKRITIIIASTIALTVMLFFGYLSFFDSSSDSRDALEAIPPSTALLLQSNNAHQTWRKISETNIIWEEFMSTHSAKHLDTLFSAIDSSLQKEPELQSILKNNPFWLSFHLNKENKVSFLFSTKIPKGANAEMVNDFFTKQSNTAFKRSNYHGANVFLTEDLSYALHEGILIMCTDQKVLNESIDHFINGSSIQNHPDFKEVWATKGEFADANLFINYIHFPKLLNTLTKIPYHHTVKDLSIFSSWSELDITIKPNTLSLNGFTYSNDTVFNFINAFADQKPEHHDVVKVLPSNTATFLHFGMSNFKGLMKNYKQFLATDSGLDQYQLKIQRLNENYGIDIDNHFLSWIENEVAFAVLEPASSAIKEDSYAILKTNNLESANGKLDEAIAILDRKDSLSIISTNHKGFTIRQLPIPSLFKTVFGQFFAPVKGNYFTEIDNYFIFGNSPEAIKTIINSYLAERTLAKDENFIAYSQNLATKSNILLYSNIARSVFMYEHFTNQSLTQEIDQHLKLYRKFEAFSLQVSREDNNLFYHNLFLKHNPVYKKEFSSLWEVALDDEVNVKPALVKNHYTNAYEVFVQDEANTIYLLSTTGKVLWKRKLEEPIVSDIAQVDIFKNDKLQLIFNTQSRLFIIDRLGRDVSGFPVKLPSKASAPLKILDYNDSKDYRFLVPTQNGNIYNYDKKGKEVNGWKYKAKTHAVTHPLHYFLLNKKDYIVAVDSTGQTFALDRRGRVRVSLKEPFAIRPRSNFFVERGRSIDQTRLLGTDAKGNLISLYFDGDSESMNFHPFGKQHQFKWADVDNDASKDFIFVDKEQLEVYNTEKESLFKVKLDSVITAGPTVYNFSNSTRIGVSLKSKDQILLFDKKGNLSQNFPMYGNSAFSIGDINKDNIYELVVCGKGGFVYVYTLE